MLWCACKGQRAASSWRLSPPQGSWGTSAFPHWAPSLVFLPLSLVHAALPFVGGGASAKTLEMLQQRVKRQENLLQRCKETIRSHKEQCTLLVSEKEALQEQLEERLQELEKIKVRDHWVLFKWVKPDRQAPVWPEPPLGSRLHPPALRQCGEGVLVWAPTCPGSWTLTIHWRVLCTSPYYTIRFI